MTDPSPPDNRWRRLLTAGILSVLVGLVLVGISAGVTPRLSFSIGSEQIAVQPVSVFELPSIDVSITPPPVGDETPLSVWLADQVQTVLSLLLVVVQAIGGLLVVIGTLTLVITITLVER